MAELYWVEGAFPGRLAVAERPRGGAWLADEMADFVRAGVTVLVSALGQKETRDCQLEGAHAAAAYAGLSFRSIQIPNLLSPRLEDVAPALEGLAATVLEGANVAVHCFAGIGRSPLIVSALLVLLGLDAEEAWRRVALARGREVPDTLDQRRWVHTLESHVRARV